MSRDATEASRLTPEAGFSRCRIEKKIHQVWAIPFERSSGLWERGINFSRRSFFHAAYKLRVELVVYSTAPEVAFGTEKTATLYKLD